MTPKYEDFDKKLTKNEGKKRYGLYYGKGSVNFCVFALTCFLTKWTLSWFQIEKRSLMGCLFFKSSHSTFSSSGREKRPILEIWTTHAKNEHDVTFVFAF